MKNDLIERLEACAELHSKCSAKWGTSGDLRKQEIHIGHANAINEAIDALGKPANAEKPKPRPSQQSDSDGFAAFWRTYPRKVGKGSARKAWTQMKCEPITVKILDAVDRATQCNDWRKDGGQFIPHPATWLRREGWEDVMLEYIPVASNVAAPLTGKYRSV